MMTTKFWIAFVLALPACAAHGQVAPPAKGAAPTTAPVAHRKKGVDPATVQTLLEQGRACLEINSLKAARDCYLDLLSLEPHNPSALSELGYVYLKLEDFPRAKTSLDSAAVLPQPQKHTVINASAVMVRSRIPMRAAKFIREYMTAHPAEVDESMLNALGTALSQADDSTRIQRFFADCVTFYDAANTKLEATRPGEKRWGSQWMRAKEADEKNAEYKKQMEKLSDLSRKIRDGRNKAATAQSNKEAAASRGRFAKVKPDLSGYDRDIRDGNADAANAQEKYDKLAAKIEHPPFDKQIAAAAPQFPAATVAVATPAPAMLPPAVVPAPAMATPAPLTPAPAEVTKPAASPPAVVTAPPPVATAPPTVVAAAPPTPEPRPASTRHKAMATSYAAGFAVAPNLVVTSAAAVDGAGRVTVQSSDGDPIEADVLSRDEASGLALLKLSGKRVAYLNIGASFNGGAFQCVSFPTVSLFDPTAEALNGSAVPPKTDGWQVRISKHPRLAGAPLISGGCVVGVELATRDTDASQIPAASLDELKKLLSGQALPAGGGVADATIAAFQITAERSR